MLGRKKYVLLLLGIFFILFFIIYYREKLLLFYSSPTTFLDLVLTALFLKDFTIYSLFTGVLITLFTLAFDLSINGWEKSSIRKLIINPSNSSKLDLFSYFLSVTGLFHVLQMCFSLGIAYLISSIFMNYFKLNLSDYFQIPYVQPILFFVLLDLKHYLEHRFMHLSKFWNLHAYHHSATEFTILTNARGHLLEESIFFIFTGIFIAIMGRPMHDLFIAYTFRGIYGYILHGDIKTNFGWVGRWILMTPQAHKLHHSIHKEDYGKNFGTLFIWWDKLFKTYKEPYENIEIGILDENYNQIGFFKGQWIGFLRWINSLSGKAY